MYTHQCSKVHPYYGSVAPARADVLFPEQLKAVVAVTNEASETWDNIFAYISAAYTLPTRYLRSREAARQSIFAHKLS